MLLMTEILLGLIENSEVSSVRYFDSDTINVFVGDWRFFIYVREHEISGAEFKIKYCLEDPGYDPQEAADKIVAHAQKYFHTHGYE